MRQADLGAAAAEAGGSLVLREQGPHVDALDFMQQKGLIQRFDDGAATFSADMLVFGLACSGAVPGDQVRATRTAVEFSCVLKLQGWRSTPQKKQASIASKKFAEDGPYAYLSLLVHFADAVIIFEEEGFFSHARNNAYYETVEAACGAFL